jgi:TolB protein
VAWVEIVGSDDGLASAVRTSRGDGGETTRTEIVESPPFYLAWSPDGNRLAALGSLPAGLGLHLIDLASVDTRPVVIGRGQPLYFAWAPDGQSVLAHLDGRKMSLLSLSGEERGLELAPATFGAPQWRSDGAALLTGNWKGDQQQIVLADPSGTILAEIANFDGAATFSLSPDGARVAFVDTTETVPTAALGALSVAALDGSSTSVIDAGPVMAFFWSPEGDKLAYLTPTEGPADGPRVSLDFNLQSNHLGLWLQWHVWDGQTSYELSEFKPSDTFLVDYLRFFDQYSRSMTPWAPDGHALVFAGESADEEPGVWVQEISPGAEPVRASDGVFAAWSPR